LAGSIVSIETHIPKGGHRASPAGGRLWAVRLRPTANRGQMLGIHSLDGDEIVGAA